jgi:hypothetical protein
MTETENRLNSTSVAECLAGVMPEADAALPAHLVRLPGTHWAVWRWIGLRGAGFPASEVLKLAAPECADAADALLEAEAELEDARKLTVEAVKNEFLQATGDERRALEKTWRRLKKDKFPNPPLGSDSDSVTSLVEAFKFARERFEATQQSFKQSYEKAVLQVSQAIREVSSTDRFQEAVLWQNRQAFHTGIASILRRSRDDVSQGSKQRQHEELVASYLQRYCLKNDTIGFFGPVGWARFVTHGDALVACPGAELLDLRKVYFEVWGIDALGESLTANEQFRPWIAPRRMSHIRLEGRTLLMPSKTPVNLSISQAAILKACDGYTTARQIAAQVYGLDGIKIEEQVFELLRQMETTCLISWTLEACIGPYPEESLKQQFERIGDPHLRAEAESKLAQLEAARTLIAQAAGNPQQLDLALSHLEETFTALTGAPATRAAGRTYAGRTLVYEDCRRDIEVEVGPEALEALGEPLTLLLESARWFTHIVAETYRRAFDQHYEMLTRKSGSTEIEFATFWASIRPLILEPADCPVNDLTPIFQQRWSELLEVPHDVQRVQYRTKELREKVLEAFNAPRTDWSFSRYHNPDVMIVASDAEAVRRGDYLFVLGELHIGANTLGVSLFMEQHPASEEVHRAVEFDMPEPRLMPLVPKYWPHATPRLLQVLITSRDYRLELAPGPFDVPPGRILTSGQLIVTRTATGQLVLRTRDGKLSFDIIEAFAGAISGEVCNHFKLLRPAEHTPRISFDRLVVCRETWRFPASDVWFAFEKEAANRFAEARRWAGSHELPRFVFVKTVVEIKPFYLDLASPVYVELLAKVIRRCVEQGQGEEAVVVTEMLPGPGESWLPDAAGERYTSELRIVAVCLDGLTK